MPSTTHAGVGRYSSNGPWFTGRGGEGEGGVKPFEGRQRAYILIMMWDRCHISAAQAMREED